MHVAGLFCARLARKNSGQGRFALGQTIQRGDDIVESLKMIHAVRAAAEFARSLRPAEQKNADDCDFAAIEVEDFLQAVFELGDAAVGAAGRTGETFFLQRSQRVTHRVFLESHYGVAIVFLVARVYQSVQ